MKIEDGNIISTEKGNRFELVTHEVPLLENETEIDVLRHCNSRATYDDHGGAYFLKLREIKENKEGALVAIINEIAIKASI